jgi:hypothetical protein
VPDLFLHGREVRTVFDLLGEKEDDLTYALGWALANSPQLTAALLKDVYLDEAPGAVTGIRLQEFIAGSGRTDIEIETERLHLIVEAKRGWNLPPEEQLALYAPRFNGPTGGLLCVVAEGSPEFAAARLPEVIEDHPCSPFCGRLDPP